VVGLDPGGAKVGPRNAVDTVHTFAADAVVECKGDVRRHRVDSAGPKLAITHGPRVRGGGPDGHRRQRLRVAEQSKGGEQWYNSRRMTEVERRASISH